ncbi:hypothetical protein L1987_85873 [Smallanthus sonchifolius]|uniref:Uncharacterized protein n=1 Tax=Smallanthus sonchifolius TaxID=185202 RepID=A0ACB8XX25_9ASTR|nr:hypothetical protein L1987_85873 [Smallanthus sonchifolius]
MLIEFTSPECKSDEANDLPLSTSQLANEAEAEILTAAQSSDVVISEAKAEASSYAKQLDEMKVKLHEVSQVDEDEELARQLQEQLNKEAEEEEEKKRKEDAKFRISDSKLAK